MCSLQNVYSRCNDPSDQMVFSPTAQSWHRYQKKRWAMFPQKRWKYSALFHWAVCIHDECFLCISLFVCHHLVSFTFCGSENILCWRTSYWPALWCRVPMIWGSSSSSDCPIVYVSVFLVVSLKGSKLPLNFFLLDLYLPFTDGWGVQVKSTSYMFSFVFTLKSEGLQRCMLQIFKGIKFE